MDQAVNVLDLENCDTHQSIYACLLRALTLRGTVIFRMCRQTLIQNGFDRLDEKGKKRPPSCLKQEFRDLELLNEITCLTTGDGQDKFTYKVRGLIYWNRTHFTCRMIGKSSEVYYNDGVTTGTTCIHEGKLSEITDVYNTKGAQLTYVILSLV